MAGLVKARFVPLRLAVQAHFFTFPHRRGAPDPLGPLGTDCGRTKAPALCVSTAGGRWLGSLNRMGTFDPERVYRFLRSALGKAGLLDPGRKGKAWDLLERGELEAAERAFKRLPRPEGAYGLSRAAALLGNHELSLEKAREAARAGRPPAADARVQEGVSLMRLGDFDRAEAALEKALESPSPPARLGEALYYLGCLAWRKKDPEKALSLWKRLVREKPGIPWALRAEARMSRPGRFGPYENLRSLPWAPRESTGKTGPDKKESVPLRALRYLLETQEKDGSWPSDTEKYRS
ncbi:MAG TPA: tetratricopeptide repeat protein, partial [Planctomycetes bacterium]|nr:tetratricopeptide repeat protein [Planctomycetota bacterium]